MPEKNPSLENSSIYREQLTYLYLIPQYLLLGLLLFSGPILAGNPVLIFMEIISCWGLLWVLWTNYVTKFDMSFRPKSKARLIAKGPYKFIRHPFSTAIMLVSLVLMMNHFTLVRFVVWILLIIVLVLRTRYEEKVYAGYFNDFSLYKQRTYKLIPFVY